MIKESKSSKEICGQATHNQISINCLQSVKKGQEKMLNLIGYQFPSWPLEVAVGKVLLRTLEVVMEQSKFC
ncbi:hypothetical protein E2562_034400 [Oryza meyeriana var. granulata]|uniref:Uncharacterized protein n=1 Tax=Oryza meyeriana var. granulata TaxID=110450 RepID=A0A6G1CLP3_9ORYZ|nr:hypothetical protein E2562_034400 [Oryza meyeriana var. granulata]